MGQAGLAQYRNQRIHMVGIGGASMSGLAEMLHHDGFLVSGSDSADSYALKKLRQLGLDVRAGHAILWAGYPGQAGGMALADILLGQAVPSGKLPMTFYRNEDTLPEFTDYSMKNRTYRYHEAQALYPFGFGLSYTSFVYGDAVYEGGAVSVTIRNEGSYDAEEIAQVYVKAESPDASRNPRLAGFARAAIKAGEEKRVHIPLDSELFTVINEEGNKEKAASAALYIGGSQPDERSAQLLGKTPLRLSIHS